MALAFTPTQSKSLFVGRQAEMEFFDQVLRGDRPEWMIHLRADGGAGKTRLLQKFREHVLRQEPFFVATELIDFYNTEFQTEIGLLAEMARQLGNEHFATFADMLEEFQEIAKRQPEPGERQDALNRLTDAFVADYEALLEGSTRMLLLFDTTEQLHHAAPYLLDTLLPRLHQLETDQEDSAALTHPAKTIAVLAGRRPLPARELSGQLVTLELPALTLAEMRSFFEEGRLDVFANESEAETLYERTGGRPLWIALSYDWLANEIGTLHELLSLEEPFGLKLVGWLHRLHTEEKQAILYTSLAWRRMEPGLLATLLGTSSEHATEIIVGLSRFSFVKYRPPYETFRGAFQLHDAMRDLVNEHIWTQEGSETRTLLLAQVLQWYETRLGKSELWQGKALPETDEEQALVAEWLYYLAQIDVNRAFRTHGRLFRNASHTMQLEFCDILNQELRAFEDKLDVYQQDELRFRQALTLFRREDYKAASEIWHSLLRRADFAPTTRATTLTLLVELEAYSAHKHDLFEHAAEAEKLYHELLEQTTDEAERDRWNRELGQLYNNWGYAHRVKGNWEQSLTYYDKALRFPGYDKNIARTLNNMGYIYFLQGDPVLGKSYVGQSLQIRKHLQIPAELGYSYITMGQFMEFDGRLNDAVELYVKAENEFDAAHSERGLGMVWLYRGRVERWINDFEDALDFLIQAQKIFERQKNKDNLVTTYNELGCIYRETDEWESAEFYLKASLDLSRELGRDSEVLENLEDLAVLSARRAKKEYHASGEAYAHLEIARRYAEQLKHKAENEPKFHYRVAKIERLLGDLDYAVGDYDPAFAHYFTACRLMVLAKPEARHPYAIMQRRYAEFVDRLQDQLHSLPQSAQTKHYTQQLLAMLDELDPEVQRQLGLLRGTLETTMQIAQKQYIRRDLVERGNHVQR